MRGTRGEKIVLDLVPRPFPEFQTRSTGLAWHACVDVLSTTVPITTMLYSDILMGVLWPGHSGNGQHCDSGASQAGWVQRTPLHFLRRWHLQQFLSSKDARLLPL